jgi:hypothetical protein
VTNDRPAVVDAGEFESWLRELGPAARAEVEGALARDPDLRGEVRLILDDLPETLRRGFLRRFQPAVESAERPSTAVLEGLRGAAHAAVKERRKSSPGPS